MHPFMRQLYAKELDNLYVSRMLSGLKEIKKKHPNAAGDINKLQQELKQLRDLSCELLKSQHS